MQTAEEIFYSLGEKYTGMGIAPSLLVSNAMKEYAKAACKEQRRLCAHHSKLKWSHTEDYHIEASVDHNSITHAPEPEFK